MDELNPFRIEAAWKLSRWDALENYLDVEDGHAMSTNQFSVGVGKLLLSAKAQNSAKDCFQRSMAQLRAQLMGPVVAVSMEKRAYHRAYDHLVQLHILQVRKPLSVLSRKRLLGSNAQIGHRRFKLLCNIRLSLHNLHVSP